MIGTTTSTWEVLQAIGIAVGSVCALAGILWKPLRWIGNKSVVQPIKDWHTTTTTEMLEEWGQQRLFSPNGGKSLYDISQNVQTIGKDVATLTGRVEVLEEVETHN